jgi:hypothetical protein
LGNPGGNEAPRGILSAVEGRDSRRSAQDGDLIEAEGGADLTVEALPEGVDEPFLVVDGEAADD